MQSLQARIDSFKKAKRIKRYPNKPSSSTASVKWPHPPSFKANPDTLAEAGFFFSPSWGDRDSVACFLCGKELSDWDESDDPFEIHYTKCQSSCAWAVVRCGLTEDLDDEGRFVFHNKLRLPSSKAMEKMRLRTFGDDWWPHDDELDHGAASAKMAQAGFVYTPQAAGDDTVTCLYCNLSLSGWERQDDPIQEHRSRDKPGTACPFLVSTARPPAASTKSRRKTKMTRSKSSKASAQSSRRPPSLNQRVSHDEEPPIPDSAMDVEDAEPAPEPPTNGSTHSLPSEPEPRVGSSVQSNPDTPPVPAAYHPDSIISLSSAGQPAIANAESLTHSERTMTLEQWIRQEISFGYEKLQTDGRRQIESFKTKAAELRKCIDGL